MARPTNNQEQAKVAEDPDDIVRIVALRFQEERLKAGLSQKALAEKAGISPNYIYGFEYGTTNPTLRTMHQLAKALKIDIRDVFPGLPLAPPTRTEVQRVSETLAGLAELLKQHLSQDHELSQREMKRRSRDNAALLAEVKAIVELGESLDKVPVIEKKASKNK
jgi:transcriptional regulator with XRE-family HTH domain